MNTFVDRRLSLTVMAYKVYEELTTDDSLITGLESAYQSACFGNSEPALIRMGKGFHDSLLRSIDIRKSVKSCDTYGAAQIIIDARMDNWLAQLFRWDLMTFPHPILFTAATVRITDGV